MQSYLQRLVNFTTRAVTATIEFEVSKHEEFISRAELSKCLSAASPNLTKSPKAAKGKTAKAAVAKAQKEPNIGLNLDDLPSAPVTDFGVTAPVMQFLEVSWTIPVATRADHPR